MKALRMTPEAYQAHQSRIGHVIVPTPQPTVLPKYRNTCTVVDGERCDSKKEAAYYLLLKDRQATGEIRNLVLHGLVKLEVNGVFICAFCPDFLFEAPVDGVWRLHAEDTKGMKKGTAYQMFQIKARLFEAVHKTLVKEI